VLAVRRCAAKKTDFIMKSGYAAEVSKEVRYRHIDLCLIRVFVDLLGCVFDVYGLASCDSHPPPAPVHLGAIYICIIHMY
jgi:hypothetical protein